VSATSSIRGDHATTFFHVTKEETIASGNLGQGSSNSLNFTPSVVSPLRCRSGCGLTGFRIRGTRPNRINATVNGIPLNDAESHWRLLGEYASTLASSVKNIQITWRRTSTNGGGYFWAGGPKGAFFFSKLFFPPPKKTGILKTRGGGGTRPMQEIRQLFLCVCNTRSNSVKAGQDPHNRFASGCTPLQNHFRIAS